MYTTTKEKKKSRLSLLFYLILFVELKNICKAFSNRLDGISERDKQNKTK